MLRANQFIRQTLELTGIKMWEVAEQYGCTESTLSKKLRTELSTKEKEQIYDIIQDLYKSKIDYLTLIREEDINNVITSE